MGIGVAKERSAKRGRGYVCGEENLPKQHWVCSKLVQDLETLLDLKREICDSAPDRGFFLHALPES